MEPASATRISAGATIRDAFSTLIKPPFRTLLILGILVSLVSNTLPESADGTTLLVALILVGLGLYLQIAVTVAAADPNPTSSSDVWLKEAFARRCFWRYFATSVFVLIVVVLAGIVGLIIGGFVMGGVVALSDPAVVLERRGPADAISRSAELSKGNRGALALIFGVLILIPGMSVQVGGLVWDLPALAGDLWPLVAVVVLILGMTGAIALTRTFLALGGRREPIPPRPTRG
jgi:hypothetical protein